MADKKPLQEEETALSSVAYESLEREIHEVLQDMAGVDALDRYRVEYEKLHRALQKSHNNEKRLGRKCRELSAEIVANAARVQTALKLSQEDQATIASLKKEIDKAWKIVDASHEKENRAKEIITQLREEIQNLNTLVEQGTGLTVGQEHSVQELIKVKEELTRQRDSQMNQIVTLRNEIMEKSQQVHGLREDKLASEQEIHALRELIATKKAESDNQLRRKERLERELKELKAALEQRQAEIKTKHSIIAQGNDQISRLEGSLREQRAQTERALKDYDVLNQRCQKVSANLEEQIHTNTQLLAENSQRAVELKTHEDEISRQRQEIQRVSRIREGLQKRVKALEDNKGEVERTRDLLRQEILTLEREIEQHRRAGETDKKKCDDLMREREILNKNLLKASGATQRQIDLVKINENHRKTLEAEINSYKVEAQKQRKHIFQLELDRERYGQDASEATAQYLQAKERIKIRDMTIADLQKKIADLEMKLKSQQNLYEAVRSDRNLYSKNLIEAQDEIAEMKRKFRIMNHQIQQLKEEINAKDHALVMEHFDYIRVDKDRESLKNELQRVRQQLDMADQMIRSQQAEIQKLNHIINEADAERLRQKKEYDIVINERDILGTQLIRRNDELALLYEKIKIQQSLLSKGESQYRERMEDIRVLKLKIAEQRRELRVLRGNVSNVDGLRSDVYRLQKELLQERTKVKALSEELENPMNIHRWRKLEGSDPSTYEMILKIQTLQKRLISKTEECVEKDLSIQEKEKMYMELKGILARQPGPEVAEQLNLYQTTLKERTRQLKAQAAELNMYQAQVNEHTYEISRLNSELQAVKKKYFASHAKLRTPNQTIG